MKTTKILSLALCASLSLSLLAGCGGTDTPPADGNTTTPPVADGGKKTVVKVQWIGDFKQEDATDPISGATLKGMHVLETEFEKQNTDIDLQFILMGWDDYQKKTQSMLMNKEADVYQAPGIGSIAEQGLLEPLESYIEKNNFDLSVYFDGQVDGWKVVGPNDTEPKIYGLPLIGDTRYIAYDKQIFDDWGVEYLSEAPTIEEILEKSKKMTGKNPKTGEDNYGIFHKGTDAGDTLMNINEHLGGTWGTGNRSSELKVTFNTDTMAQAATIIKELNTYAPNGVMANQGGELFGSAKNNIAINLRCNPAVVNNIEAQGLGERYAVSRLFINEKEGMGGMFAGSPAVIAANSEVKDAAWKYLAFTASEFFMNYFWENQRNEGLPVIKAALDIETVKSNANITAILKTMPYLWTPRYVYRAGQGKAALSTAIEEITLNGADVKTTLDKAQKEVDEWVAIQ